MKPMIDINICDENNRIIEFAINFNNKIIINGVCNIYTHIFLSFQLFSEIM